MASNTNFDELSQTEEFGEWFWKETNRNKVIKKLNESRHRKPHDVYVSQGKRAHVYGVGLNSHVHKHGSTTWKYCKIGLTQVNTETETDNRMEIVMKKIKNQIPESKPFILFVFLHDPTDCTPVWEVEPKVRAAFGCKVPTQKAKELNLPVPTEWVLTTQDFIMTFKGKIKEQVKQQGYASTKLFEAFEFDKNKYPLPADWLDEQPITPRKNTGGAEAATVEDNEDLSNAVASLTLQSENEQDN